VKSQVNPSREPLSLREALQIDMICNAFEDAWHADARPQIEEYLSELRQRLGRPCCGS